MPFNVNDSATPVGSEAIHFCRLFFFKILMRILKVKPQDLTLPGSSLTRFAFCYNASHFGMGLLTDEEAAGILEFVEKHLDELRRMILNGGPLKSAGHPMRKDKGREATPQYLCKLPNVES